MPRVEIPVQVLSRAGVEIGSGGAEVTGDTTNQHFFNNSGSEFLVVRNSGGAEYDVTIITGATVDGQAVADRVVSVPAGDHVLIGPFPETVYDQPSGTEAGKCQVDVENVALMLQCIRMTPARN